MYVEIERIGEMFGVSPQDIPRFIEQMERSVVRPLTARIIIQMEEAIVRPLTMRIAELESLESPVEDYHGKAKTNT